MLLFLCAKLFYDMKRIFFKFHSLVRTSHTFSSMKFYNTGESEGRGEESKIEIDGKVILETLHGKLAPRALKSIEQKMQWKKKWKLLYANARLAEAQCWNKPHILRGSGGYKTGNPIIFFKCNKPKNRGPIMEFFPTALASYPVFWEKFPHEFLTLVRIYGTII